MDPRLIHVLYGRGAGGPSVVFNTAHGGQVTLEGDTIDMLGEDVGGVEFSWNLGKGEGFGSEAVLGPEVSRM